MTLDAKDFNEVPCKNKCGNTVPSYWHLETKRWVYDGPGLCESCLTKIRDLERRKAIAANAGLTASEMEISLESFHASPHNRDALDAAKRMALGDSINLLLTGHAGRGKTHLAIGILNGLNDGRSKFLPVTRWLMDVRNGINAGSEDYWLRKISGLRILVLDDFGANKLTDWNLAFTDCVIDEWYRNKKKGLIVTSNFSLKEIGSHISDRIASRLAQMCEVYEIGGRDWRIGL